MNLCSTPASYRKLRHALDGPMDTITYFQSTIRTLLLNDL